MTTFEFRSAVTFRAERASPVASAPPRKETLAIVSTGSRLCGIAAYTAALRRQLEDDFEITVFNLDQYLMRNPNRRVRKLADRQVNPLWILIS